MAHGEDFDVQPCDSASRFSYCGVYMSPKPLALDLFCGAGGVSVGLRRAGFEVVGVDIEPMPDHRGGQFVQANALTYPLDGFDFVWASPPCQAFTAYKRRPSHVRPRANLIPAVRRRLLAWGGLFAIENVKGAPLIAPIRLCGSSFGLDVRRHRFIEANFEIGQLPCRHDKQTPRFAPATNRKNLRSTVEIGVWRIPLEVQQRAMGIDWMPLQRLSQAIPPAYAEHVGRAAIAQLR